MTTLQEIMKEFEERWVQLHPKIDTTKPTPIWATEPLKQFIEKSYLAGQNSMPQPADVIRLGKELETDAYKRGKEDEKKRIDTAITEQFKYAYEHDNYDMRGVDWELLIHEDLKQSIIK